MKRYRIYYGIPGNSVTDFSYKQVFHHSVRPSDLKYYSLIVLKRSSLATVYLPGVFQCKIQKN